MRLQIPGRLFCVVIGGALQERNLEIFLVDLVLAQVLSFMAIHFHIGRDNTAQQRRCNFLLVSVSLDQAKRCRS